MTRRIVHVSMPTTEGVPVVLLSYVRDQLARGWDVSVVCPVDGWLAEAVREAGARVLVWPATRSPGPSTWDETRRLGALLTAVAPDLVHLHSSKAGLAGRLALRGRVPTVFQPHAWSFRATTGVLGAATVRWERLAARWTSAFVFVSAAERDEGLAAGVRGRSWVVPNGVDLAALHPADAAERAACRARLGLAPGPLAVCVGRLNVQKGQHDLLDAWPAVRLLVPDARLVLVGDGPERAALEARRVPGVQVIGNRTDVPDWLAAATVVVAPSRWEGMALAPLEAMARARAVVATDVAGAGESLPADAATIVPAGAGGQLAAAVAARLADPDTADAVGLHARRHVEQHHDALRAAEDLIRVYSTLIPRS